MSLSQRFLAGGRGREGKKVVVVVVVYVVWPFLGFYTPSSPGKCYQGERPPSLLQALHTHYFNDDPYQSYLSNLFGKGSI